jgi:hypothetical protein
VKGVRTIYWAKQRCQESLFERLVLVSSCSCCDTVRGKVWNREMASEIDAKPPFRASARLPVRVGPPDR